MGAEGVLYWPPADVTYVEVIDYTGDSTDVVIIEKYNGLPVTRISSNAFEGKNITSVIIPNGVTHIDDRAFAFFIN